MTKPTAETTGSGLRLPPLPETIRAGRLPGWDPFTATHRPCPVCGADQPRPLVTRPDGLVAHACVCGMTYLAEVPGPAELADFYSRYGEFKQFSDPPRGPLETRRAIAADPWLSILERTGGLDGRSVCEVGCSSGRFLELARRLGARVFGVELDQRAREALARKGIESAAELPAGRAFDVVCAFQVLEHLTAPGELVTSVASALAADGRFLVAVPNGGEAERVGPSWVGFRADLEHLNYFSARSLSELLCRRGLWVEQWWERDQPHLQRPAPPAVGLWPRLRRRLLGVTDPGAFHPGRYTLTALARKV